MSKLKIPRRLLIGIVGVLVICVLVGVGIVSAVVSTPGAVSQAVVGEEVIERRTETSKTYYLGDGSYGLLSTGALHYQDEQGDWQQINNAIVDSQMLEDAYNLYILQDQFDEGQIIEWSVGDEYIRFQPMALAWTNDLDQIDQISMPQPIAGVTVNTLMPLVTEGDGYYQGSITWEDGYGTGRDFQWTATPHKLKKLLTLDTAPPTPAQYIIDGGNPVLRLSFIFDPSSSLDIYIDGTLWDKSTETTTFNAIEFRKEGETLWIFSSAEYWDAVEAPEQGATTLRKVGNSLYVDTLVPYEWLQGAQYPVSIDPDITIQPSSKDNYIDEGNGTTNYGSGSTMNVGLDYSGGDQIERSLVQFAIDWGTDIPDGATIDGADMSLYKTGDFNSCVGRTYNCYRLAAGRLDWEETEACWLWYRVDPTPINWSTAGASHNPNDYTPTDGAQQTVPADNQWMTWTITAQVITAQTGDDNVACRISDNSESAGEARHSYFKTKEGTPANKRPKLYIEYTEAGAGYAYSFGTIIG